MKPLPYLRPACALLAFAFTSAFTGCTRDTPQSPPSEPAPEAPPSTRVYQGVDNTPSRLQRAGTIGTMADAPSDSELASIIHVITNGLPTAKPAPFTSVMTNDPVARAFLNEFATNLPPVTGTGMEPPFLPENPGPADLEPDWDKKILKENALKNYANGQIDFKLLRGTDNYRKDDPDFPPELKALDGKAVEMIGFIALYDDFESLKRIFLTDFSTGCNFCTLPSLRQIVFVEFRDGKDPKPGYAGLIRVKGTLLLKSKTAEYYSKDLLEEGFDHNIFNECIFIIKDAEASIVKGTDFSTAPE